MKKEDKCKKHKKPVILAVDDDPNNLAVLRDCLTGFDYTVLVAEDGVSAVTRADYALPDLILLDVMMPGIDGYETCRRLKHQASTENIPVIFMSALADSQNKIDALESGAVDYITKPFHDGELIARIKTHLNIRDLRCRLQEANDQLESRVAARTADLVNANELLRKEYAARQAIMAKLIQINRMSSLGILVASIVHDINTPNGAISLAAQHIDATWESALTILEQVAKDEGEDFLLGGLPFNESKATVSTSLSTILNNSDRISRVIQSLRAYHIGTHNEMHLGVSINKVVEGSLSVVRANSREGNVPIKSVLATDIPDITGNRYQLEQVVVNLILNAMQASSDSDSPVTVQTEYLAGSSQVCISVIDQGCGIPAEVKDRVFEAFYSTKIDKGGSGLGLYIANYIISEHSGRITIEPGESTGTVATVYLPVTPPL